MPIRALLYVEHNYSFAILRPLQDEVRRRGGEACWFFAGNTATPGYLQGDEKLLSSLTAVQDWCPDVVFAPGNFISKSIPGLKVQVFHGLNSGKINRKGRPYHFEIRHCFDLYCTDGSASTERFSKLQKKFKTFLVAETGWSALDPLFENSLENPYIDSSDERKTVLFCSTHSPRFSCAETIYEKIKSLSSTGKYRWLVQFHPKMRSQTVEKYKRLQSDNLSFVETDNVIPLIKAAEVMLCDTSSILVMFLLQHKPVVTFRNENPGDYLINIESIEDIEPALEKALDPPDELIENIKIYGQKMHPYRDGVSSARIVDAVENILSSGAAEQLKAKPLNLIREYKERRKLASKSSE